MPFDVDAVRREFWRLDRTGGTLRHDRVPTKEEIHARWHWRTENLLRKRGLDPAAADVGRDSFLLSGRGRPLLREGDPPLERRFRYDPMPLDWFENSAARAIFRDPDPDPDHGLLELLCGKHLAGWANRPSGTEMFGMLTEGAHGDGDQLMVRELLADIQPEIYPRLRRQDALSVWHVARAALECEVRRGALSWWLNQFTEEPANG